jgi:hypothetical protein
MSFEPILSFLIYSLIGIYFIFLNKRKFMQPINKGRFLCCYATKRSYGSTVHIRGPFLSSVNISVARERLLVNIILLLLI